MKFYALIFTALLTQIVFAEKNAESSKMIPGDVANFELPSFDKKSGYKEWELFGKKAKYFNENKIDVFDMKLDMFDGKKTALKMATFTTDYAEVSATEKTAKSESELTVKGDGFVLVGDDWLWNGDKRFVELYKSVKVNFESQKDEIIDKLDIKSEEAKMTYTGSDNIFTFYKNVRVSNDEFQILCGELETESPKKSSGGRIESLREVHAKKDVAISHDRILANAQEAILIPNEGRLFLSGAPKIRDINSGASVEGYKIEFTKDDSTAVALSSPDKKTRAKARIVSEEGGRKQTTTIYANSIKMVNLEDKNLFFFSGKVHIDNPEFEAFADEIEAYSDKGSKSGKYAISKIVGKGGIEFVKDARRANSDTIEIYPQKEEIWLEQNARLSDRNKGITLKAHEIVLTKEDNRATAFGDRSKENSFVAVDIAQAGNLGLPKKSVKKTRITSRSLMAEWKDKNVLLRFTRDVEVSSDDILAKCNFVEVFAQEDSAKGKSDVKKIEAFGDVVVSQNGSKATAQIAKIYPNVEIETQGKKSGHRFMEFLTDGEKPQFRPKMILPEIGNIGFAQISKDAKIQKTQITSDKQSYVSGKANDTYIFEGNVIISGTDFGANCDRIEVAITPNKFGKLQIAQISLIGNLKIAQGKKLANAGRADINPIQETVVLTENPIVQNEDGSRATGTKMTYTRGKQNISIENPRIKLPPIGETK